MLNHYLFRIQRAGSGQHQEIGEDKQKAAPRFAPLAPYLVRYFAFTRDRIGVALRRSSFGKKAQSTLKQANPAAGISFRR
jgi:hypothetical protein